MKRLKVVSIVGVGLIGGSIGLALRRRGLAGEVVGIGRSSARLKKARRLGCIDRGTLDLAGGVARADLVVVCTPVASIGPFVRQAAAACPSGTLITDAGSTKAHIASALGRRKLGPGRYVGSHPLAGSEQAGCEHAREDLFDGRIVVVTPTPASPRPDVRKVAAFWRSLGAKTREMSPGEHDRALAAVSHLPHLVAAAIAGSTGEDYLALAASGWRDTTRVAAGDPELWQQILLANRSHLLRALDRMERSLGTARRALESEDPARLKRWLSRAKKVRDAVGN